MGQAAKEQTTYKVRVISDVRQWQDREDWFVLTHIDGEVELLTTDPDWQSQFPKEQ